MVCQTANLLALDLKTHFRPAQHNFDVRPQRFKQAHHLCGLDHVPDIDTQANDFGFKRQQLLNNLRGPLLNYKLPQLRLRPQPRATMHLHIGQQVAQTK